MKKPTITTWVLSSHAALRAQERNITATEIRDLLADPDEAIAQGDKWIFAKSLPRRDDNLVAAVVLEKQEKSLWLVVTVMVRFEVKQK